MKEYKMNTGTHEISFRLDEKQVIYYAALAELPKKQEEARLIEEALDHPYGAEKLEDAVPEGGRVVIIVDDATRPTPCARILPHLLARIEQKTKDICIMTAPGTHRPMSEKELDEKIGREILERYPLLNVDYTKEEDYEYVLTTELGTPVDLHKEVLKADFVLAVGNIVPHVVVGWSGGAKTIQPGVSARRTTDYTHWIGAVKTNTMDIVGTLDNICRKEIDYIGSQVNLSYIVNTVLNEKKEIQGLFCGHFIEAHRAGVELAEQLLCPVIDHRADIVIANAAPCCFDFWQAFKPYAFAQFGVKEGGTIIFLFEASEGLCGNAPFHLPALKKYMPMTLEEILKEAEEGKIEDEVGATNAINHHKLINHAEIICVSDGLADEDYELLKFKKASTVEEAVEMAKARLGENAEIGMIPFCGETLVKVKGSK